MRKVRLGRSPLYGSAVGMGTMGIGGYFQRDETSDSETLDRIRYGIDLGLTFIDTAEIYGAGHAEELVGKAVLDRRDQVIIATKFSPEHSGRPELLKAVDGSLRRLQTDYIDVYQTHWPNPSVPFAHTLETMGALLESRKVRTLGLSNTTEKQWDAALRAFGADKLVSIQEQYNVADRLAESVWLPACRQAGVTLISYSPLLEGRIAPDDGRKQQLRGWARERGVDAAQLTLAWLLRHPEVIVIPKAGRPEHLEANAEAAHLELDAHIVDAIDKLYAPRLLKLVASAITPADATQRNVYKTIDEALRNPAGMKPSPAELAEEFRGGERFKPIKVLDDPANPGRYVIAEGRLRYWAWRIAYGDEAPMDCLHVG